MVVTRAQTPCRQRSAYLVDGITSKDRVLSINDPDVGTLEAALMERMYFCKVDGEFKPPLCPDKNYVFNTLHKFRSRLLKNAKWTPKISPEQFVQMYVGRKRTIYDNALPEFYATGVLKKHALSNPFVKCEKVKPTSAPRCIQPRKPVYNIGVGTYLKANEHTLYKAIAKVFGDQTPVVMKGMNVKQIAEALYQKWIAVPECVCIGLDATKFDMHVSMYMLMWEHSIYIILSGDCPELKRLLRMQLHNVGVGFCEDGKLRYKVDGRRFSGDMNTALGNCIIMCAMVYAYSQERQVPIKFGNNGDDCVVFMSRKYEPAFRNGLEEWFLRLGFRMAVEQTVNRFTDVEFCQMHPVQAGGEWVMVRNFDTAREKDSLSVIPLDSESMFRKWIYAVGEGGVALTSGVPIFQAMYLCYMRNGKKSNIGKHPAMATGMRLMGQGLTCRAQTVTPMARATFFEAWGYTPDEQEELERYYNDLVLGFMPRAIDSFAEYQHAPL